MLFSFLLVFIKLYNSTLFAYKYLSLLNLIVSCLAKICETHSLEITYAYDHSFSYIKIFFRDILYMPRAVNIFGR